MPPTRTIHLQGVTDVGCSRSGNEDCFIIQRLGDPPSELNTNPISDGDCGNGILAAVSDGMGGAAAGEVASSTGLLILRDHILANAELLQEGDPSMVVTILESGVQLANKTIYDSAQADPNLSGMGATVTAAYLQHDVAYMFQIGDSRAYALRGISFEKITRDQSFVGQLLEMGTITEAQAAKHPQRNLILQALGAPDELKVDVTYLPVCKGDFLLLCSDGLYSELTPDVLQGQVKTLLEHKDELILVLTSLVDSANKAGGRDNITVLGLRCLDGYPKREPGEDPRYRQFPYIDKDNPMRDMSKLLR